MKHYSFIAALLFPLLFTYHAYANAHYLVHLVCTTSNFDNLKMELAFSGNNEAHSAEFQSFSLINSTLQLHGRNCVLGGNLTPYSKFYSYRIDYLTNKMEKPPLRLAFSREGTEEFTHYKDDIFIISKGYTGVNRYFDAVMPFVPYAAYLMRVHIDANKIHHQKQFVSNSSAFMSKLCTTVADVCRNDFLQSDANDRTVYFEF